MLDDLKSIWNAFVLMVIRFFDNRCKSYDEVDYLRLQLSKVEIDRQKLLNSLLEVINPSKEVDSGVDTEFKPIGKGYTPWSVKRMELEKESFDRVSKNKSGIKSVEELEKELSVSNKE